VDIVLRAALGFVFIYVLLRVMGRRELSTHEPFDLILLVVIGDLVQQGITQSDYSVTGFVLTIGTFALLTVAFSYANYRFKPLRPILEAEPRIVIQDGKPVDTNLRRERLTVEEIAAEARQQQIPSLDAVAWAVLEGSGKISFITRSGS
jgi:uncharacterized membrane protein YcaP (DUF421 family)